MKIADALRPLFYFFPRRLSKLKRVPINHTCLLQSTTRELSYRNTLIDLVEKLELPFQRQTTLLSFKWVLWINWMESDRQITIEDKAQVWLEISLCNFSMKCVGKPVENGATLQLKREGPIQPRVKVEEKLTIYSYIKINTTFDCNSRLHQKFLKDGDICM